MLSYTARTLITRQLCISRAGWSLIGRVRPYVISAEGTSSSLHPILVASFSFYVSLPLSLLMMMTSIHHIYPLASHSHATNMLLEFAAVMQDNDKLGLKSLVQIFGMPYSSSYLISCYSHCLLRKNEEQISQTTRSKEGYRGTRRESRSLQQSAPRLLFICQHPDV